MPLCPNMIAEFLPALSPTDLVEPADTEGRAGQTSSAITPSALSGERGGKEPRTHDLHGH